MLSDVHELTKLCPGHMIRWIYENEIPVVSSAVIWSTIMGKWVHISDLAFIISNVDETLTWLNSEGKLNLAYHKDIFGATAGVKQLYFIDVLSKTFKINNL